MELADRPDQPLGRATVAVATDRSRSGMGMRHDSATAAVHTLLGPLDGEPACDGVGERYVEARPVGPHPGLHRDVPLVGGRWVQIDATDDVAVACVEDGECESDATREVVSVAAKVGEVLLERHAAAWWPVAVGIAGSGAYVLDARHPGGMIRLIVLRPQRFEAELIGSE